LRKEVKKCNIDKDKFPYKDNTFDRVISKNVIEHLTNPGNLFKESYRVLKKGGHLEINTDNAAWWGLLGKTFYGGYEKNAKVEGRPNDKHYMLSTPHTLKNFYETFGFKNVKYKYVSINRPIHHKLIVILFTLISRRFYPGIFMDGVKD